MKLTAEDKLKEQGSMPVEDVWSAIGGLDLQAQLEIVRNLLSGHPKPVEGKPGHEDPQLVLAEAIVTDLARAVATRPTIARFRPVDAIVKLDT